MDAASAALKKGTPKRVFQYEQFGSENDKTKDADNTRMVMLAWGLG
jgi:hypothetical protein